MTRFVRDPRIHAPLAVDLVDDTAALYDRIVAQPGLSLEPEAAADELTTLLPYADRVADVTRLVARLLECLVVADGGMCDLLERLGGCVDVVSGSTETATAARTLLYVAASGVPVMPLAVRDQFLLDPDVFTTLPDQMRTATFAAAVVALRVTLDYVHGCFAVDGLTRGRLLHDLAADVRR